MPAGVAAFDATAGVCGTVGAAGGVGALERAGIAYETPDGVRATIGGVGAFETTGGGVGGLDASLTSEIALGVVGFFSCLGVLANALNGWFSASGEDTGGAAAPHTELSASPRCVLPLRPDSAERPETLSERSPVRIGSGTAVDERGVWLEIAVGSRDLALSMCRDALEDVEVVRVRSSSKLRGMGSGTHATSWMRGDACTESRVLNWRDGTWETERSAFVGRRRGGRRRCLRASCLARPLPPYDRLRCTPSMRDRCERRH